MRALLDFENSASDLLQEPLADSSTLLWPLARWPVSRAIAEHDIGTSLPTYARPPLAQRVVRAARRAVPNPRSARHAPAAPHLFVVSGWTKTPTPRGYENWLTEDFARALGHDAVVLQDAYLDLLSRGNQRPLLPQTFSYARALERIEQRASAHPLDRAQRERIQSVLTETFRAIEFRVGDAARDRAIADVLGRVARVPASEREFARVLDRVRPRRIYMQTAAYGNRAAEIRLAHARGVEVAELQHGWIGGSHAAYNFGSAMTSGPLHDHLPDTLLSFGEYWGQSVRFPGRVVAIGKPSLDRQRLEAPAYHDRPHRVLLVSSHYEHEVAQTTVLALRDALPEPWTIVVRPHPVERSTIAARMPALAGQPRIEFDTVADATASLLMSRAVVGFSSTMLFEALAYGCHVAVMESALASHYADAGVFPLRIAGPADIPAVAATFCSMPTATDEAFSERVWQPDAVQRFVGFARSA